MTDSTINCDTHGSSRLACVCTHTFSSLDDGVARGFTWWREDDGGMMAFCDACCEEFVRQGRTWNRAALDYASLRVLCESCASSAARLNGIDVSIQ